MAKIINLVLFSPNHHKTLKRKGNNSYIFIKLSTGNET